MGHSFFTLSYSYKYLNQINHALLHALYLLTYLTTYLTHPLTYTTTNFQPTNQPTYLVFISIFIYVSTLVFTTSLFLLLYHNQGLHQSPFSFRLTYKTLRRSDAVLRYGNSTSQKVRGELTDGMYGTTCHAHLTTKIPKTHKLP